MVLVNGAPFAPKASYVAPASPAVSAVNKLCPNLKNGCKFSVEERLVIEMQAQTGNKWARIAYLPGRTDNDVKNFWSSRQKRLARMRQAGSSTSSTTPPPPLSDPPPDNNNYISPTDYNNTEDDSLSLQVQDQYNFSLGEMIMGDIGDSPFGSKPDSQWSSLFSAHISHKPESMRMVELPDPMMNSNLLNGVEANKGMITTTTTTTSHGNPSNEIGSVTGHLIPFQHSDLITYLKTEPEGQVIIGELLVEPSFMDVFGESGIHDQLDQLGACDDEIFCCEGDQQEMIFGDQQQLTECCNIKHGMNNKGDDLRNPDLFFDDFPCDVFDDQMESLESIDQSLPSPSKW